MRRIRRVIGIMVVVVMIGGMLSCSVSNERRNRVRDIGDVVWRENNRVANKEEVFVMVDEDSMLVVVKVGRGSYIESISKIRMKVIEKDVVIGIGLEKR